MIIDFAQLSVLLSFLSVPIFLGMELLLDSWLRILNKWESFGFPIEGANEDAKISLSNKEDG